MGNNLDLNRSTRNISVITYLVPIVSTVEPLCLEHMKQISGSLGATGYSTVTCKVIQGQGQILYCPNGVSKTVHKSECKGGWALPV